MNSRTIRIFFCGAWLALFVVTPRVSGQLAVTHPGPPEPEWFASSCAAKLFLWGVWGYERIVSTTEQIVQERIERYEQRDMPPPPLGAITTEYIRAKPFLEFLTNQYPQKAEQEQLSPSEQKRQNRLEAKFFSRFMGALASDFVLEGTVVDRDGQSVEGVELKIVKVKRHGVERKTEDREIRQITGRFSVIAKGVDVVRLYFSKPGYFRKKVEFVQNNSPAPEDIIGRNPAPRVNLIEHRDLRIVLEKIGNIVELVKQDFELTFRRQNGVSSGGVIGFDWHRWELRGRGAGSLWPEPVNDLRDPEQLPSRCLYVQAAVNRDGSIASTAKTRSNWHRPVVLPQKLRLVLNDPEGGGIVYEQKEGERAFWSMKEAPEEGYQQELVIDADWLFRRSGYMTTGPDDGIYFYFKVDGRYGKGKLGTPKIVEDNRELEVRVQLQMQLDGSRNLDTGRN
ncbi:MAG: carboxypeptidase regulatory-like domain-containing protein [Lentisphaerae bacterium]|nr:carboxypeptidase regulatory-like domain-containing protein [Lentisphaerota bacterium]